MSEEDRLGGEIGGSELLKVRCQRRGHVIGGVVKCSDGRMVFDTSCYSDGPDKSSRVARRVVLTPGSGHRYQCACGVDPLLKDDHY